MKRLTVGLARPAALIMGRPIKKDADKKGRITLAISKPLIKEMQGIADAEFRSLSSQIELVMSEYVILRKSKSKKVDGKKRNI